LNFNPSEKYEFISWDPYSQYMESHKIHVPNHQPALITSTASSLSSKATGSWWFKKKKNQVITLRWGSAAWSNITTSWLLKINLHC